MNVGELYQLQPVLPAPMCDISDFAFRSMCRRFGGPVTTTQMVSSEALARGDRKSLDILELVQPEPCLIVQVFGSDPHALAESTRILAALGPAVIDFNMGCPARKINQGNAGAALLRDLPRAAGIFRAMRAATALPLTVKMRWDWDADGGAALDAARIAEAEGFNGICLHARTRAQGYSGEANWEQIARVKEVVSIPVVGNGDIREPGDTVAMLRRSGCDAVMIGRALIGDPWLLGESLEAVRAGRAEAGRHAPDWESRREVMRDHAGLMVQRHGPRGLVLFRKHAAAYIRGLPGARRLRERLMRVTTMQELDDALQQGALLGA